MNRSIAEKVSARILPMLRPGATVAVLGLSYKPFSHVTEESQGLYIAQQLSKNGVRVVTFDPMSSEMELEEIRRHIVVLDSLSDCIAQSDAVLITTPDPVFNELTADDFKNDRAEVLVIDFWRLLKTKLEDQPNIRYVGIGIGNDDEANAARLKKLWTGDEDSFHTVIK
jgi:UDPglucose 6-dehydrogenase